MKLLALYALILFDREVINSKEVLKYLNTIVEDSPEIGIICIANSGTSFKPIFSHKRHKAKIQRYLEKRDKKLLKQLLPE